MRNLVAKLLNNNMFKGFSLLLGGTAVAQIFSLLLSPILTRVYNPAEYGINSVFTSVLLISSVFATLKLQVPISISNKKEEKSTLLNVGFISSIVFSIILLVLIVLFNNQLTQFFKVDQGGWLYALPFSTVLIGIYELLYNNSLGNREYKTMALVATLKVVFQGVFQLFLSLLPIGYMGLILGNFFSYIAVDIILINANKSFITKSSKDKLREYWQENIDYPRFAFPAELLGMTSRESLTIVLTFLFSPTVSGLYALANRLIGIPINLVANSLRQVYIKEASVEFHSKGTIKNSFKNSSLALFAVAIPMIIILYWIGPLFFKIVFGSEWVESGYYLRALSFYFLARFTIVPLMASMYVIGKTRFEITANSIVLISVLLISIIFYTFNINEPEYFLLAYSLAYLGSYILIYIKMWMNILRLDK